LRAYREFEYNEEIDEEYVMENLVPPEIEEAMDNFLWKKRKL